MTDGWVIATVIQEVITNIMLATGEALVRFLLLVGHRMIPEQSVWNCEADLFPVRAKCLSLIIMSEQNQQELRSLFSTGTTGPEVSGTPAR